MIEEALRPGTTAMDPVMQEALRFRELVMAERDGAPRIGYSDPEHPQGIILEDERDDLTDRAYEVERRYGPERARAFYRLGSGRMTPLKKYLEVWLAEKDFTGRTKYHHRTTVTDLEKWCRGLFKVRFE